MLALMERVAPLNPHNLPKHIFDMLERGLGCSNSKQCKFGSDLKQNQKILNWLESNQKKKRILHSEKKMTGASGPKFPADGLTDAHGGIGTGPGPLLCCDAKRGKKKGVGNAPLGNRSRERSVTRRMPTPLG